MRGVGMDVRAVAVFCRLFCEGSETCLESGWLYRETYLIQVIVLTNELF